MIEFNDISDTLLIVNQITIDKLYSLENGGDNVALYMFYYKTAKWQKTNQIKASDEYCMKCLNWGYDRLRRTKKTLRENGLIEVLQNRKDDKIAGWYVKVNYFVESRTLETYNNQNLQQQNKAQMLNNNNNMLNNNNNMLKENNNTNVLFKESPKKFVPPSLEEIKKYCEERKNNVDAQRFYDYYQSNNWKDQSGKQVQNWKQKMIANWEKMQPKPKENKETFNYHYELIDGVNTLVFDNNN